MPATEGKAPSSTYVHKAVQYTVVEYTSSKYIKHVLATHAIEV